jgi:hypothetical protein
MARTRRSVPHWVKKSELRDKEKESRGEAIHIGRSAKHDEAREKRLPLRKQVETGNFDHSDHEHSESIEIRKQKKARIEDAAAKEDLE